MNQEWVLQTKETKRKFSTSTWVPLRASIEDTQCDVKEIGHVGEYFGCGSVAFPYDNREIAEGLSWSQIGIGSSIGPYAYRDGFYSSIEQYQFQDKEPIGIHLVLELPRPVVGSNEWLLNPDLVAALRLIKEGNNWVRPEENFAVVARQTLNEDGKQVLIEIKREFLQDYLAARNMSLKLSYYRQRIENVDSLDSSEYAGLVDFKEEKDGGRFELLIRAVNDIFGGSWSIFRMWRTDVDEESDAPVLGPETEDNTGHESTRGNRGGYAGVRVEGEFWRDEWIEHNGLSKRVRGDADPNLPQFIIETDGARMASDKLNNEDIGRWLWFRLNIINELLSLRGFSLLWYTAETGAIKSTSGHSIHFGINSADFITVYAYDIARLPSWEQHLWSGHNIVPDGKVSTELLASQVKAEPAETRAVEELFFDFMDMLEEMFRKDLGVTLFSHNINRSEAINKISRFASKDQASLLRLAKEIIRVFSDRLNVAELRKLSSHKDKEKLGSNKLLEDILAQKAGTETARKILGPIVGAYDMRIGDAHPTSSKIGEALNLAGIDENRSFLRQGEQLISNVGQSIYLICKLLFSKPKNE